jgi:hypothetical protein
MASAGNAACRMRPGVSPQLMNFVSNGQRAVTPELEQKVVELLKGEAKRLGKTAVALDAIRRVIGRCRKR